MFVEQPWLYNSDRRLTYSEGQVNRLAKLENMDKVEILFFTKYYRKKTVYKKYIIKKYWWCEQTSSDNW